MPAIEQHQPSERSAAAAPSPALQDVHHSTWGPGAARPEQPKQSDAMQQFGQFCIGFGDGLGAFAKESVQAVGNAITHPAETISSAVEGTKTAVSATVGAVEAGASYVGNHVAKGDYAGMANDAVKTGEAVGSGIGQAVDNWNHLSAHDKGFVVGHDVAPTVVATVALPELDLVAGAGKVMEVAGTIVKESGAMAKVAETFDGAITKMSCIGDKLAALSKKMEAFTKGDKSFVHCAEAMGKGGSGEIATGMRPSEAFYQELQKAHDSLSPKMQEIFKTANFKPVHNLGEVFGEKRVNTLGAWVLDENNLYMAENTGFKNALRLNNDIQHVFRHELGHMLNDTIGSLTGTVASDMPNFIKAFNADLKLNNPKLAEALKEIGKTCGTINQQRHEIFADMFAHVTGPGSVNGYSNMLKEAFPNSLKEMAKFVEENGL